MKKTSAFFCAAAVALMATSPVYAADVYNAGPIIVPIAKVADPTPTTTGKDGQAIVPILQVAGDATSIHNQATVTYTDIQGHFASQAVTNLTAMGLISNDGSDKFEPYAQIDRQLFKTWMQKVSGIYLQTPHATQNAPYVTRLEVAQWIAAAALPGQNTGIAGGLTIYPYDDTPNLTDEQRSSLLYLYHLGVMVGDGHRHFSPNETLSRGEAAVLLDHVLLRSQATGQSVAYNNLAAPWSDTVNQFVNEHQATPGLYSVVENGARVVMVTGGEVPTGGYSVTLDNVTETDAGIFVQASLHSPDPSQLVPQMVTYPKVVFALSDTSKPVYLLEK